MDVPRKVSSTHLRQISVGSSFGSNEAPDANINDSYVAYIIVNINEIMWLAG